VTGLIGPQASAPPSSASSSDAAGADALELCGLRKVFGSTTAVDDVDLAVRRGSFFGLVGPNGAGKSTTLSMAVGLLRPDAGTARVHGVDVWEQPRRARALVGVLPEGMSLPDRLTGSELLTYLGRLRGLDDRMVERRVRELLAVLDLDAARRTLVIDYSTGMRKKLFLATALLHAPRLLVLDEPFEAVDPVSASSIKMILRRFVAGGGSVVFSSHVMALVEELCDTLAVIVDGRVRAAGALADIRGDGSLEEAFVALAGGQANGTGSLSWLG
jgi:ABC-2 type transport system ATP-binding protein